MKKTNKGFSLVELIIVIAIMAILAGAIAPALIRYIDKSRKSNDVSSAKTIKTSIETAMAKEKAYEAMTNGSLNASEPDVDADPVSYVCSVTINPGVATANNGSAAVEINGASWETTNSYKSSAEQEIATNIGEKTPRIKYKKDAKSGSANDNPQKLLAFISKGGSVVVGVKSDGGFYQLAPNVNEYYQ